MSYGAALNRAWDELTAIVNLDSLNVRFLNDEYSVDLKQRRILSLSCNIPAKDYLSVLLLHYLIAIHKGPYEPFGRWISFKDLSGGESYWPAFKKRAIEPILRKYQSNPDSLLKAIERFDAERSAYGEPGIVIKVFEKVSVLIALWPGDDEFSPDANILFDSNIDRIFTTEDVVIMSEFVAKNI